MHIHAQKKVLVFAGDKERDAGIVQSRPPLPRGFEFQEQRIDSTRILPVRDYFSGITKFRILTFPESQFVLILAAVAQISDPSEVETGFSAYNRIDKAPQYIRAAEIKFVVEPPPCLADETMGTSNICNPSRPHRIINSRSIRSPFSWRLSRSYASRPKTFGVPLMSQTGRSNNVRHSTL